MDLLLDLADHFVLDNLWAKLLPLSAFVDPQSSITSPTNHLNATTSVWTSLIKNIPHPPMPDDPTFFGLSTSAWPRDYIPRQVLSLSLITVIGIHALYFIFATLSYYYIFNHDMMRHPKFLKNQVRLEIQSSLKAFPMITLLTLPWFQAEVMGYSKLYDDVGDYGWTYLVLSVPL